MATTNFSVYAFSKENLHFKRIPRFSFLLELRNSKLSHRISSYLTCQFTMKCLVDLIRVEREKERVREGEKIQNETL